MTKEKDKVKVNLRIEKKKLRIYCPKARNALLSLDITKTLEHALGLEGRGAGLHSHFKHVRRIGDGR